MGTCDYGNGSMDRYGTGKAKPAGRNASRITGVVRLAFVAWRKMVQLIPAADGLLGRIGKSKPITPSDLGIIDGIIDNK